MVFRRIIQIFILLALHFQCAAQERISVLENRLDRSAALHVVTFLDPECPISQRYTKTLTDVANSYAADNVIVYGVISVRGIQPAAIDSFVSQYNIGFQCIRDERLQIARAFNARITPEVFLLDSVLSVLYSGAIDDWYFELGKARRNITEFYLRDAIDATLQGNPVAIAQTEPVGCHISFRKSDP